ncbi:MAG: helix-turn-helix domain-containing protein [Firmicutes bacterium]|nr:helix-turn-helix domain-containing protein [Bacillota bacterium]
MRKIITDNVFGQNLQKIRLARGMTQEQTVAKLQLLGSPLTRGTYSLIEMGRGNIYLSDLVGLKQIFNTGYSDFFEGVPPAR